MENITLSSSAKNNTSVIKVKAKYQKNRDRLATIRVVDVVVVEIAVVAVEIPRVVDVVPLGEPTVRAGRSHI